MNGTTILDAAGMAAVVLMLVGLLKPFVESVSIFADTAANAGRHDAALRILNVLLNIGVVFLVTAATSGVTSAQIVPLIVQALAQAAGVHGVYQVTTMAGGASVGTPPVETTLHAADPAYPPGVAPDALTSQLAPAA